jgi:hypothetical protein
MGRILLVEDDPDVRPILAQVKKAPPVRAGRVIRWRNHHAPRHRQRKAPPVSGARSLRKVDSHPMWEPIRSHVIVGGSRRRSLAGTGTTGAGATG